MNVITYRWGCVGVHRLSFQPEQLNLLLLLLELGQARGRIPVSSLGHPDRWNESDGHQNHNHYHQ